MFFTIADKTLPFVMPPRGNGPRPASTYRAARREAAKSVYRNFRRTPEPLRRHQEFHAGYEHPGFVRASGRTQPAQAGAEHLAQPIADTPAAAAASSPLAETQPPALRAETRVAKPRRELTPEQREAKNAADRARRAAKKAEG